MLSLPDNLKSAIMQTVNCFLPYVSPAMVKLTVDELRSTGLVNKIYLLASDSLQAEACDGCEILQVDTLTGTNTLGTCRRAGCFILYPYNSFEVRTKRIGTDAFCR